MTTEKGTSMAHDSQENSIVKVKRKRCCGPGCSNWIEADNHRIFCEKCLYKTPKTI